MLQIELLGPRAVTNFSREEQENPIVPRLPRPHRASSIQQKWISLLSVLATALLLVSCFRVAHLEILPASAGRSLAGSGSENDEDAERSAILEMCLDMQEEAGINVHFPSPLPSFSEALPLILETLAKQSPDRQLAQPAGGVLPSASLELTAASLPSQTGPYFVATARRESEGMQASDDAAHKAVSSLPWNFSAASLTAPLPAPLHDSIEVNPRVSSFLRKTFQTSLAPSQPQEQPGVSKEPFAGPLSSSAVRAGSSEAKLHAGMAVSQSVSPFPAAKPQLPGPSKAALGRKRGIGESTISEDAPPSLPTSQPKRKNHHSGWERPFGATSACSLPVEEQSQGPCKSSSPTTSQELGPPVTVPVKSSSPTGQSGEASSAMPLLPGDGNEGVLRRPLSPLPGPAPRMLPSTHVYYRVPLFQPGKNIRKFDCVQAFAEYSKDNRIFNSLLKMRSLLTLPEINTQQAQALIASTEDVVGRLYYDLQLPVFTRNPGLAVGRLGRFFMYLDMIISVIQVLEPFMNASQWWPQIQSVIPPHTVFTTRYAGKPETVERAAFATQLSNALQVLKECVRLGEKETVEIKSKLLFGKSVVKEFRCSKWDPWREATEKGGDPVVPD